jgi:hypothetical protein
MKKIFFATLFAVISFASFAQDKPAEDEETNKGFQKDKLFTGGGIDFGLSTYNTVLGIDPVLGYSLTNWLDAGIVFNFTYLSERVTAEDYLGNIYLTGDKIRETDFGPGAFVRLYPVDFLFVQGQFEENYIKYKEIYASGGPDGTYNTSAASLLLGGGYCTGRRAGGGNPFFYLSVSADVLANRYSPYVTLDGGGNVIILPIIRGGIQVPLFQGKQEHRHRRRDDY